jgi:hypothetical protein
VNVLERLMMRLMTLTCVLSLTAFAEEASTMDDRRMKPEPKRNFADGAPLRPAAALKTWLGKQVDAKGKPRRVRLPVEVTVLPTGVDRRGFVGGEKGLALTLDDSAMGVGLADHARRARDGGSGCTLLLDGVMVGADGFKVLWISKLEGPAPTVAQVEVISGE